MNVLNSPLPPSPSFLRAGLWADNLRRFGRATGMALAMASTTGVQLSPWYNSGPLWDALTSRTRFGSLCRSADSVCTCVDRAVDSGTIARSKDSTGLVHFAIPLIHGGRTRGVLVAGQVFDRTPDRHDLPPELWWLANREPVVSPGRLEHMAELLVNFATALLDVQIRQHESAESSFRDTSEQLIAAGMESVVLSQSALSQMEPLLAGNRNALVLLEEIRKAQQALMSRLCQAQEEIEDAGFYFPPADLEHIHQPYSP